VRPLAVKIPGRITSNDIEKIREAEQLARQKYGDERRDFGLGNESAGHTVTFLQDYLDEVDPHFRHRLSELVIQADSISGWNVTHNLGRYTVGESYLPMDGKLTARCIEVIRYKGGEQKDDSDSLGWHADGSTLMTTAVLLTPSDEFEGGSLEFMNDDNGDNVLYEHINVDAGDFVAWRGWTQHKVRPILFGHRDVLVVEWWSNEDVTESQQPRGADTIESITHAISLDPTSSWLQTDLGRTICRSLPCDSIAEAQDAEHAFRKAVSLAPLNAMRHRRLAEFVGGFDSFQHYHTACSLEQGFLPCSLSAFGEMITLMVWGRPVEVSEGTATSAEDEKAALQAEMKGQFKTIVAVGILTLGIWLLIRKLEGGTKLSVSLKA